MYRIQKFDKEGEVHTTKNVGEASAEVPFCIRKALNLPNVVEVELHEKDGRSVGYTLERQ